jgi:hypothetical protein
MRALLAALFFLGAPFWETKPPEKWSDREVDMMRHNSPWAQPAGQTLPVLVYLATAAPIEEAETEARVRTKNHLHDLDPDYSYFITQHREDHFVLAIPYTNLSGLGKAEETKKMEEESVMMIGRKSHPIDGYFPPTPSDPVLRLVFPRVVKPTDKSVLFRLYLPGIDFPDREVEFRVKELMYHGKLEM